MKKRFFIIVPILLLLMLKLTQVCSASDPYNYDYHNPIAHNSLTSFFKGLLISIQNIVGLLAVVFIVIGGVIYLTASGKDSQLTLAKNTIVYALTGFTLAVAGPSLLKEIQTLTAGPSPTSNAIANANPIAKILTNVLDFSLTAIGILALMSLIFSGFSYLSSAGNRTNAEKAKKIALYSIIALAVSGGSLILVETILKFLGA